MKPQDRNTIGSFLIDDDEPSALPLVDRSTLEAYANCPIQARFIADGRVNNNSAIAEAGNAVHDAFSSATSDYVGSSGSISPTELVESVLAGLRNARPDIQPDSIRAARASVWAWSQMIHSMHYANVLRFDGGEGEQSGQLAWDISHLGCRVTSEIDLLYSGPSPECLHEIDYKSGHKFHTAGDVRDSFQFQLHAWLVLNNYPEVNGLRVQVWNTRINRRTWAIEFTRDQLSAIHPRILHAAGLWKQHAKAPIDRVPAWPEIDKCCICPAAAICPMAGSVATLLADDPSAYLANMIATEAKLDAMKKAAGAWVDAHGDIVTKSGTCYGANKPPAKRKPTKAIYTINPQETEDGEGTGDDAE